MPSGAFSGRIIPTGPRKKSAAKWDAGWHMESFELLRTVHDVCQRLGIHDLTVGSMIG
jgi:hypothetical protein